MQKDKKKEDSPDLMSWKFDCLRILNGRVPVIQNTTYNPSGSGIEPIFILFAASFLIMLIKVGPF